MEVVVAAEIPGKECGKCKVYKLRAEFGIRLVNKDKMQGKCRQCVNEDTKIRREQIRCKEKVVVNEKKCSKCENIKLCTDFPKNKLTPDGLSVNCKECTTRTNKGSREKRKLQPKIEIAEKECKECRTLKPATDFNSSLTSVDGRKSKCKLCYVQRRENNPELKAKFKKSSNECAARYRQNNIEKVKEKEKKYKEINKGKIREQIKVYRENNKEKISERTKIYKNNNKEKINERRRKYMESKQNDPRFKIERSLRGRIWKAVKKGYKTAKTMELLGCEIEVFMKHIENQFTEGMTWENYGEWHLDHARPCASFNLLDPEQQKICFHYSNLQPLWAKDNLSKGAKWDGDV